MGQRRGGMRNQDAIGSARREVDGGFTADVATLPCSRKGVEGEWLLFGIRWFGTLGMILGTWSLTMFPSEWILLMIF